MDSSRRIERLAPLLAFAAAAAILLVGLGRHGIWDPTELAFADSVRNGGHFVGRPPLQGSLVALGFKLFGIHDWSGRVVGAMACLATAIAAMGIARRHFDAPTAAYAAIAAVASPLVVLNARWMMGDGGVLGAQSLFGLCVFTLAFEGTRASACPTRERAALWGAAGLVLPFGVLAILSRGALMGVLPPLLAVLAVTLVDGRAESAARRRRYAISAIAMGLLVATAVAVARDLAVYSVLIGGSPSAEASPSFERFLQIAVHTLAPWSVLFVIGAARSLVPKVDVGGENVASAEPESAADGETARLRLALVLWAVFSFGAAALFSSRYGTAGFFAVVPVAVLAAVTLREAEIGRRVELAAVLIASMLLALVLRDFAIYPASPLAGVPANAPTLATEFQPKHVWALLFLAFGLTFGFGASSRAADSWPPIRQAWAATLASVTDYVRRQPATIAAIALLILVELVTITLGVIGAKFGIASIGVRAARAVAVGVPVGLWALAFGTNLALRAFSKLGRARMLPTVLVGVAFGAFIQGPFLVELSGELSPREVYATYTRLRHAGEELVEFDIASRAASYYVGSGVKTAATPGELVTHLSGTGRRWAMFRRSMLPEIDRLYRTASGQHLVIADARNLEVVLATNSPIAGHRDQNPLASAVRGGAVRPQHRTAIRFEDVELIGYDLTLPNGETVGAGQNFRVTWYWKVLRAPTRDWRIFVHVDGAGLRLNGDHDPVEGLLPTRQWQVGDTIADTQELSVPSSYPAVDFTLYLGFYSGNDRMTIVSGEHTPDNRAIAGQLSVR